MSHRLVPSIYQVFIAAIDKVHIPPGLWRTFRDYAHTWRHRPAVIYGRSERDARYRSNDVSRRLGSTHMCPCLDGDLQTLVARSSPSAIRL